MSSFPNSPRLLQHHELSIDIVSLCGGKMVEDRGEGDNLGVMQQVGTSLNKCRPGANLRAS